MSESLGGSRGCILGDLWAQIGIRVWRARGSSKEVTGKELPAMKVISLTFSCITVCYLRCNPASALLGTLWQTLTSLARLVAKSSKKYVANLHVPLKTTPFGIEKKSFQLRRAQDLELFSSREFYLAKKNTEVQYLCSILCRTTFK